VPEYIQQAAAWCKKFARVPVIVKLTPNITNILPAALAAKNGGADGVSLINTMNSIMRVDYDSLTIYPSTDGMGSHGGYCCAGSHRSRPSEALCPELMAGFHGGRALGSPS
jgi:dihydropyrimidine dehydrogenase (NAD+) subunit PreA